MQRRALPLLIAALLAVSSPALAEPAAYYAPPSEFNAALQVMDMGFSNDFALIRNATGSFTYDEATKTISNLRLALDATSMSAGNNDTQRALANFLASFQYPEIRVTMPDSAVFTDNKAELKATVTMHGTSKPVTFSAVLNKSGKSSRAGGMWSSQGDAIGLSLRGDLKRADFGLSSNNPELPERFGDTVTLMLEMQAIQQ